MYRIITQEVADVADQLNIEYSEVLEKISGEDAKILNELSFDVHRLSNDSIIVINRPLDFNNITHYSNVKFDGETVIIPDDYVGAWDIDNGQVMYGIMHAIVEFYNEHADIEDLPAIFLSNYIGLKSRLL